MESRQPLSRLITRGLRRRCPRCGAKGIPWQPLLGVALATNGIFPIFFYPFSKTLWVAIDLYVHPGAVE